jgi:hypothetical protein
MTPANTWTPVPRPDSLMEKVLKQEQEHADDLNDLPGN